VDTNDNYLVVFIILQNLLGIDSVVPIIMQVLIFCDFGLKMPIYVSLGILTQRYKRLTLKTPKSTVIEKTRRLSH